jgi:ABC-type multidrug transport system ATPase subunit
MDEIAENCTGVAVFAEGKILAVGTPKRIFSTTATIRQAGLDYPFTAKTQTLLEEKGVRLESDFTSTGFINATLAYAKINAKGGQGNA